MNHFNRLLFVLLLCATSTTLFAQETFTISGYIRDAQSKEDLIGANFYIPSISGGATTNLYGFYSITLEEGSYQAIVSYLGYETQFKEIVLDRDIELNILLEQESTEIGEIVISESRLKAKENIERPVMGVMDISPQQIKELPVIGGEKDVLKSLQLLPGVQSGSEGTAGFYVRGGGPDQNLILLDEAVVYNPYHLFGFFSVFNVDAIKNVELIKGGFPARYGGRLSSILNISMKDGDKNEFHGEGGIGLISSRLTLEGPIIKDRMSFLISGRRTYLDQVILAASPKEFRDEIPRIFFYDLNAKLNYRISDKDRLYFSGYFGQDQFKVNIPDDMATFRVPWGNKTGTLRWNHVFNSKLFANTSLIYNDYEFAFNYEQAFEDSTQNVNLEVSTGIKDWNGKIDFDYYPSVLHKVQFGVHYAYHTFTPTTSKVFTTFVDSALTSPVDKRYVHDLALYASDEWTVTDQFSMNIGLRIPAFVYKETSYFGVEPRFIANYRVTDKQSIKASYALMNQYVHLVTNSTLSFPWDVWIPSSDIIKPKVSHQVAAGYFQNFNEDNYEGSVELYYKKMNNLIEYKEGADIFNSDTIENQLTFGDGDSYGAEFFLKKRTGRLNGWIGYTLSWTNRQFEELNGGRPFPAKYDRRHDLSVVGLYEFNEKWSFSAAFVYGSGHSLTLPEGRFYVPVYGWQSGGTFFSDYTSRNGFKLRAYNRLDLGIKYTKKKKRYDSIWRMDIYNVYSRRNPYFVYLSQEFDRFSNGQRFVAKQVSLLPVVPTFSWNFKF